MCENESNLDQVPVVKKLPVNVLVLELLWDTFWEFEDELTAEEYKNDPKLRALIDRGVRSIIRISKKSRVESMRLQRDFLRGCDDETLAQFKTDHEFRDMVARVCNAIALHRAKESHRSSRSGSLLP